MIFIILEVSTQGPVGGVEREKMGGGWVENLVEMIAFQVILVEEMKIGKMKPTTAGEREKNGFHFPCISFH